MVTRFTSTWLNLDIRSVHKNFALLQRWKLKFQIDWKFKDGKKVAKSLALTSVLIILFLLNGLIDGKTNWIAMYNLEII